jgi:UDP-N-acetylglucosamine 2-epimerase
MLDANLANRPLARQKSTVLSTLALAPASYGLVTVHRAANTDDPQRLSNIVKALSQVGETVVFPVHPRTRAALSKLKVQFSDNVRVIDPVGYFDMMVLEENARIIATDSGGVQREAYFMQKPCITLRDETEWTETVEAGWNQLVGVDVETIVNAWRTFTPPGEQPPIFGDGKAGEKIAGLLSKITLSIN